MSDSESVKVRVKVSFGWVGTEVEDEVEFPRADWDKWSDEARDEAVQHVVDEIIGERVSHGWEVVGSGGDE